MRTSQSHPLRIDTISLPSGGKLGLSFCPGKKQADSMTGGWDRDLDIDLTAISDWGAAAVVTLLEGHELRQFGVETLGDRVLGRGMGWEWLPMVDDGVPNETFVQDFRRIQPALSAMLTEGKGIFIHCKGGIGRTSMVAALLLLHEGYGAEAAIEAVHRARENSFVAPGQADFVRYYERSVLGRGLPPPGPVI